MIDYGLDLSPTHAELLAASAISVDVAKARGYRTVRTKRELIDLGFAPSQCCVPALLIPVWSVTKQIVTYQIRSDRPRRKGRKPLKYETRAGTTMTLDVPPLAVDWIGDPARPLIVTEGARKADAAVSHGLCCVALLGVWNFRGTNAQGGKVALGAWESVALNDRAVYIAYDSDVIEKPQVLTALTRLRALLENRGARVFIIQLSPGSGGQKTGLDDFFARGGSVEDLFRSATTRIPESPSATYEATARGLVRIKLGPEGAVKIPLTNFQARILANVIEDDGTDQPRRAFEVEAALNGHPQLIRLSPSDFTAMTWPAEHVGAQAIVYAGIGCKDHARVAIQVLSGEHIPERRLYTHTGWRLADGQWIYLHAGGAFGANGEIPGIEVELPAPLRRFRLPAGAEDLSTAVRASLGLLDVGPARIAIPLLASAIRPILGEADFSVHLGGATGRRKTELAALAQQHYGAEMDARHLPSTWNSTANFVQGLLFPAKNALVVIDDFAPGGTAEDIKRMHRDASRIFRAQGNRAGRGRMAADTTLRPEHPPRGLVLSTGEEIPHGQSVQARVYIIEIGEGEVDLDALTRCQHEAAAGRYAEALAGYIRWFAPRYAQERLALHHAVETARRATRAETHGRTVDISAELFYSFKSYLTYAADISALTAAEATLLEGTARQVFQETAKAQAAHQAASEPTTRFLDLLRAVIASGRAHLAAPDGDAPPMASAYGWRPRTIGAGENEHTEWQPQGDLVGWIECNDLYLEPEASYATAQRQARDEGEPIAVGPRTLAKRLDEGGLLIRADRELQRYTTRVDLQGVRRRVLYLAINSLLPLPEGETGPTGPGDPSNSPSATATLLPETGPTGPTGSEKPRDSWSSGPVGPISTSGRGLDAARDIARGNAEPGDKWEEGRL